MRFLLLPGMDGTGDLFEPFLAALPANVQATVISYPLHEKLSYDTLEQFVWDRLPDQPFIIVAESFSGPLAIRIAGRATKQLHGIVLTATFVTFPGGAILRMLSRTLGRFVFNFRPPRRVLRYFLLGHDPSSQLENLLHQSLSKVAPDVLAQRLKCIVDVDVRNTLKHLKLPILILNAKRDRLVRQNNAHCMKSLSSQAHLIEIDAPHLLLQTKAKEAVAEIFRFSTAQARDGGPSEMSNS